MFRPLAILGGVLKPFRFFETASEDPFGPKWCVFDRLGPRFAERSLASGKRTNPRFGAPLFANRIFETGFWGPPVGQNLVFRGLRKRPSNNISQSPLFFYVFLFSAECFLTYEIRTLRPPGAPPKPISNFCNGVLEGPGRPKWRNGRPQRPPEIAKRSQMGDRGCRRPLREHPWSPKGPFGDMRSYVGKTYIGPQGPQKVTSCFFSSAFLEGQKRSSADFEPSESSS